ncbi:aminoacyl tRNA synthase complex-interacting multifunctional protein 1 isoform X3 [Jatropha curcas]|uniref:aminoacyl tRNA synthase complex-interacting multifunctional protein 1 isoform X3 n=1 Tax=Jatropha curcas TaxID=180498 RepID=UPI0009D72E7E|nr:aminoacyl tRNA synthase complex-interacting multifunctional protein 1 isoform X3 [Jatropha curcas]XP_020540967.1 aminoacyl tRNA synthase complex-interacting multifunctional protein 1 isoform X3 [Jatropha curcas]
MAVVDESISLKRKQTVASALSKHLDLNYGASVSGEDNIKSLYTNILKSSGKWLPQKENDEVMKWIEFAESFPIDSQACFDALNRLNQELAPKSVILGNGLTPSEVDVIVFSVVHPSVIRLSHSEREKLTYVMRWMDYIQNKEELVDLFEKILLEKPLFEPLLQGARDAAKAEIDSNAKKISQNTKNTEKSEADKNVKKSDAGAKVTESKDAKQEKKKPPQTEPAEKDKEVSVSLLNIQVGLIRKAWKHPSADSLLVEEIDVGESKLRQVVSGLAKYCSPDELTNRRVVLITNVKSGKLRDVMSEGLVLCASNEDHSVVEPLLPPEGAKIGERISFSGIDGKPEDVLNPKKKQLDKITPNLFTDDKGVATYKGIPFMTSGGPCTSSIPKIGWPFML